MVLALECISIRWRLVSATLREEREMKIYLDYRQQLLYFDPSVGCPATIDSKAAQKAFQLNWLKRDSLPRFTGWGVIKVTLRGQLHILSASIKRWSAISAKWEGEK